MNYKVVFVGVELFLRGERNCVLMCGINIEKLLEFITIKFINERIWKSICRMKE